MNSWRRLRLRIGSWIVSRTTIFPLSYDVLSMKYSSALIGPIPHVSYLPSCFLPCLSPLEFSFDLCFGFSTFEKKIPRKSSKTLYKTLFFHKTVAAAAVRHPKVARHLRAKVKVHCPKQKRRRCFRSP